MKKTAFCLFLLIHAFPVLAQQTDTGWLLDLKQRLSEFSQQQPEKIYLHTDRSVYAAADTVWFKAYLLNSRTNTLNQVPEVLHLDLISEKNGVVVSQRLKTENGFKAGSLTLPDTLKTGNYLLQVYTRWQRNAGPDNFFRQVIFVNKVPQTPGKTVAEKGEKVLATVQFFPEGGKLLAGFQSRVGVKTLAADGTLIPADGKIVDETGNLITTFRSNDSGAGSFVFRPQAGKNYRAQVSVGSQKKEFPLPAPEKRYALSLKNSPDSVTILMAAAGNTGAPLYLVLHQEGFLISADSVRFNAAGLRKRTFSTRNWPKGIIQATLLNENQLPENERLFFHQPEPPLKVTLETAKKVYGRREPVQVTVSVTDQAGKPVASTLSVAVTSSLPHFAPTLPQYLFSPVVKTGTAPAVSATPAGYDELLLTQSVPYFSWEALAGAGKTAPEFSRETDLNQPALVLENNAPVGKAVIYLLETNSGKTHLLTSDAEGRIRIPAQGSRFFYQIWQNGIWRQEARLQLVSDADLKLPENWQVQLPTDSALTRQFTVRRQIDLMYRPETGNPRAALVNKDMWPSYAADKHYPLADYNELTNMEEILREMVPEVRVISRKKQVRANVYDNDRRIFFPHQPLYIIDGQPTWNNDLFLRLDASQLEQVNIYNSSKTLQNFGFLGNNGVIVVFTKSRNYQNPDLRRENILKVPGQFEVTNYKAASVPASIPDFRPTVYWNPAVQTNTEGKATITFPATDEIGNLKVQVKGITPNGRLISEELLIPVQPAK